MLPQHCRFFTKKLICLYTNIELLNCSSRGNKSRYKHIKYLDTNVFGFDISTSKLWLATFLLQQGDYHGSLQKVNDVLSAIPPYALYRGCIPEAEQDMGSKLLYCDMHRNTSAIYRARDAWLFDIYIEEKHFSFSPRAIQTELIHGKPGFGVKVSPFIYAYYLMFLCYNGLRQYLNRERALLQLVETVFDDRRRNSVQFQSYNIAGDCLLVSGCIELARKMFLRSVQYSIELGPLLDKYNPAYHYLSYM